MREEFEVIYICAEVKTKQDLTERCPVDFSCRAVFINTSLHFLHAQWVLRYCTTVYGNKRMFIAFTSLRFERSC